VRTRPRVSVKQQAGLTAVACVAVSLAVVLTVNANHQRRRADLLDQNQKVASDYINLKDLLESKTDVAAGLRDLQGKLHRYVLTVEDPSAIPTDMPGFQFVPVATFEPALIAALTTLAEYTSCSLEGWSWEAPASDQGSESSPESGAESASQDWRPFSDRADTRRMTLRVRGGWSNLQRFICGLSEFEVPIPDTSPPRFWLFPHVMVVTDLTIKAGTLPEGADPSEAPPLDATLMATAFRFKPLSYRTLTAIPERAPEPSAAAPGPGEYQPGAGPEPGGEMPGGEMGPGGPGGGMLGGGTPGGGMPGGFIPGGPGGGMPGGAMPGGPMPGGEMGPGGPGGGMPGGGMPGGAERGGPGFRGGMPPGEAGGASGGGAADGSGRRMRRGTDGTPGGARRPRAENAQPRDRGGPTA